MILVEALGLTLWSPWAKQSPLLSPLLLWQRLNLHQLSKPSDLTAMRSSNSYEVLDVFARTGISHQTSCIQTPEQNGVCREEA